MHATFPRLLAVASIALALSAGDACAFSFERVGSGFADPVYVTSAPGDASTLYVVEQRGTIEIVRGGRPAGTFLDISARVRYQDELGLLSMAFSPQYAQNHLYYVDYTDHDMSTHVVELNAQSGAERELLLVEQPYPNHKGGQLQFDAQGRLYVGMGDGGTNFQRDGDTAIGDPENRAQDLGSRLGKLLRIDPTREGAAWQAVGLGLRNPWRFSFDRRTGDLWIGDVGAGRYEEVDFRRKTELGVLANFGWSRVEGTATYNAKVGFGKGKRVAPLLTYGHGNGACSVIGGYVYRGTKVPAARGRYFFGDFCTSNVSSFVLKKGKVTGLAKLQGTVPSITSFGEDANGELYAVGLAGDLYVLR